VTGAEQGAPNQGTPAGGESPLSAGSEEDVFSDRPELFVGAAFVGGFALAQILKRLGP
jgi:hypothetical protein